jgi:sigma-B regulation protein RsbU (phosphoserine phosphatase)
MGAEDYLPKPFDSILLRARIHACLEKRHLLERERKAFEALRRSQQELSAELAEAAAYVRSLLPAPLVAGPVRIDWRFVPSTQLGGDALGYHWLDEHRLAVFLLDVCGHGIGAALLSVSVLNTLQKQSIPGVDFADPSAVLAALNRTFPMEQQNNMFFTIWYGVLDLRSRELRFACGGHPPAILTAFRREGPRELRAPGPIVGGFPGVQYVTGCQILAPGDRVHVFSDGVYELAREDGTTVQLPEFIAELGRPVAGDRLDAVLAWAARIRVGSRFEDDVSILELTLS